jgi:hypothetical protein
MTIMTFPIQYCQTQEVHDWLDAHHPGWGYLGTQFRITNEPFWSLPEEEKQITYRAQRIGHAERHPFEEVEQDFELGEITVTQMVYCRMRWNAHSPRNTSIKFG